MAEEADNGGSFPIAEIEALNSEVHHLDKAQAALSTESRARFDHIDRVLDSLVKDVHGGKILTRVIAFAIPLVLLISAQMLPYLVRSSIDDVLIQRGILQVNSGGKQP